MKRLSIMVVALCAAGLTAAMAQEYKPKAPAVAAPFDLLKKLAGDWTGNATHGEMEQSNFKVNYRVTSAGSVVMETLFVGAEHEMVSMYSMDGNDLVMTHYCSMGNQPHMKVQPGADARTITFTCTGHGGNMKSENDAHMHAASFKFTDADHMTTTWTMHKEGKPTETAVFELTRVKP